MTGKQTENPQEVVKKKRGRPPGVKNKPKNNCQTTPVKNVKKEVKNKGKTKPVKRKYTPVVNKKRPGPKHIIIDFEVVRKLSNIHCTQKEIANFLGCSHDTLDRSPEFKKVYFKGLDLGKISLRRHQFKLAENGNTTMLIWLGKQILGQKENPEDMDAMLVPNPINIIVQNVKPPETHYHPGKKDDNKSDEIEGEFEKVNK